MVNAPHHPPKGAFPQCADNLICNTTKREMEKDKEVGKESTGALIWTQAKVQHNKKCRQAI